MLDRSGRRPIACWLRANDVASRPTACSQRCRTPDRRAARSLHTAGPEVRDASRRSSRRCARHAAPPARARRRAHPGHQLRVQPRRARHVHVRARRSPRPGGRSWSCCTAAARRPRRWRRRAGTRSPISSSSPCLYPQETATNNSQLSCFRWYETDQTARGGGEPASAIIQMVDQRWSPANAIDKDHVYVTGLSAGAAFTAVMMATYPDRFVAGSIMSGLPYRCATDLTSAYVVRGDGRGDAEDAGRVERARDSPPIRGSPGRGRASRSGRARPITRCITANAGEPGQAVDRSSTASTQTASATDTISTATRTQYPAGATVVVEEYLVSGMGHDVATGTDPIGACPGTTGMYFSDEKICSTLARRRVLPGCSATATAEAESGGSGTGSDSGSGSDSDPLGSGSGGSATVFGGCNAGGMASGGFPVLSVLAFAIARRRRPRAR